MMQTTAPVEIRLQGISKAFNGNRVLEGIDLEIYRGDIVAIVGGSGCGKTVLLNHVLGQLKPDSGQIFVADHAIADAPLVELTALEPGEIDQLHTHWGVVFQRNALFSGTVLDNFALWLQEIKNLEEHAIVSIAQSSLDAVDLPNDRDFLDTAVESLSGGMAKRLAVARALSMNPIVVYYDEPTTGLDPTSASQVQDLILATHEKPGPDETIRTSIIITHDKDLLNRLQPRTVMLHEGKIFFDGPFEEFKASASDIIRPYFDLMPVLHNRPAVSC
ncbi:MAG: ATP-binding cassette domain-containing protein [Rhodospirillaceae bacterium]|jgi:phospholipid/cholesterol/gamma-HCH transport system ATP-binding protein